jgi:ribonuclease HII
MPDFSHETRIGAFPLAGMDEAGCGAWAGPVVAAAVIFFDPGKFSPDLHTWVQDSKKLTPLKRVQAYQRLCASPEAILWSVGISSVEEIEQLNIRKATLLAMKRAVEGLSVQPKAALVDGIAKPILKDCDVHTLVSGDSKSLSVAAASIVAKVTRDRLMEEGIWNPGSPRSLKNPRCDAPPPPWLCTYLRAIEGLIFSVNLSQQFPKRSVILIKARGPLRWYSF